MKEGEGVKYLRSTDKKSECLRPENAREENGGYASTETQAKTF